MSLFDKLRKLAKKPYFVYEISFKGSTKFYLWCEGDKNDSFLCMGSNLLRFNSAEDALQYGKDNDLRVVNEKDKFVIHRTFVPGNGMKYEYFLSMWNCASDICNSVGKRFWADRKNKIISGIYEKVFWGNNPPVEADDDEIYTPYFNWVERRILKGLYRSFMKIFKKYLA